MRICAFLMLLLQAMVCYLPSESADSCVGNCFASGTVGSCYCDDVCSTFGNCCPDFVEECANITLCEYRCNTAFESSLPCQCNDQCLYFGNCCEDYYESCLPGSCAGRCGGRDTQNFTCQCDGVCKNQNDCCEDFMDTCTSHDSCKNLCGARYDSSRSCQCTSDCEDFGNCCEDFETMCPNGGVNDWYSCGGQCGVIRDKCSCQETCVAEKNCCTDYEQSCNNGTSWLEEECTPDAEMVCPDGYDKPPLILFSMDGFRNSYIYRDITPNIWKLASCGVHSPYVRSVYPTKTFPNHYSIVTGLHPESHGIVSNTFYDYEIDNEFSIGQPQTDDARWWGGQPIWITANEQGLKSASYFWVGSDVNITGGYPTYYHDFDSAVPEQDRIQEVLQWLDLPKEERPAIILAYIEEVDSAGHSGGPNGNEVNSEIEKADKYIGMLMDGLKQRHLDKCVDLILLADHGMADRSCDRLTYIDQYGVDVDNVYWHGGPVGTIGKSEYPDLWEGFDAVEIKKMLQCKRLDGHFEAYLKQEYLPKRFHHAFNDRIEDVQLVLEEEWLVGGKSGTSTTCNGGTHGWDNEFKSMRAVFVAHGASFKRGYNTTEGFDNVEIYNMMCDMLGIDPVPNNGTRGSLNHMLKNPKPCTPSSTAKQSATCPYPSDDLPSTRGGCPLCVNEEQNNKRLDLSDETATKYRQQHFVTGTPEISAVGEDKVNFCMLTHQEYITAYNWNTRMPYYSSFVLDSKYRYLSGWSFCVRPDVRITNNEHASSCMDYDGTYTDDVTGGFLYPPILSNYYKSDAYLLSNVIPVYKAFLPVWSQFAEILHNWSIMYKGIAVTVGPAFDYNFDGHADSEEIRLALGKHTNPDDPSSPVIPTHIFAIIVRCKEYASGQDVRACSTTPENVEVLSFIIPNFKELPCRYNEPVETWVPRTLAEHVARVRDVELITEIIFFPDWTTKEGLVQDTLIAGLRLRTRLPVFGTAWLNDFINSATPNPDIIPTPGPTPTTSKGIRPSLSVFLSLLSYCFVAKTFW